MDSEDYIEFNSEELDHKSACGMLKLKRTEFLLTFHKHILRKKSRRENMREE